MTANRLKNILWWGRFDPDYSRNRILRALLRQSGYRLSDFVPRASPLGGLEARFAGLDRPDALWVPAFRHRDFAAARRFADRWKVPLIYDPLISAWDKVVFERRKYPQTCRRARKLLRWERQLFARSDLVLADTEPHARFFIDTLGAPAERTRVVPVGAEEPLFTAQPAHEPGSPPEILFFGSFIELQGPQVIVDAALRLPQARWTLVGDGPLRSRCEKAAAGCSHIRFEQWLPYATLPSRIGRADLLLGIFGSSPKAGRVVPNKVYQTLACGRPLITRESAAYPAGLGNAMENGISFIPAAGPEALAAEAARLLARPERLAGWGLKARWTYDNHFSVARIGQALAAALNTIGL